MHRIFSDISQWWHTIIPVGAPGWVIGVRIFLLSCGLMASIFCIVKSRQAFVRGSKGKGILFLGLIPVFFILGEDAGSMLIGLAMLALVYFFLTFVGFWSR